MRRLLLIISLLSLAPSGARAQWRDLYIPSGGQCNAHLCFAVNGADLFEGTEIGGVFVSHNLGGFTQVNTGLLNLQVYSLVVSGPNLFAGTSGDGVFVTSNNGVSWTPASSGLTKSYVWALAVSGMNLFAGTNGGVFLSTNNGTNWAAAGLTDYSIRTLAVSSTDIFAGTGDGVFRSTDNGTHWSAVNTGLTNANVNSLALSGTYLFAGTHDGVFLSSNNGTEWVTTGLSGQVLSLAVYGTNLIAGTSGNGVCISTLSGAGWNSVGLNGHNILALAVYGTNLIAGSYCNQGWRSYLPLWLPTAIAKIQETPQDSLVLADSLQDLFPSRWTLQASPYRGDTVDVMGVCTVPPGVLVTDQSDTTMVMYDLSDDRTGWRGLLIQAGPEGPRDSLKNVKQGDLLRMEGVIHEYPEPSMNGYTVFEPTLLYRAGTAPVPSAASASVSDFSAGTYPDGHVKYSQGEQYEGMAVKIRDVNVYSILDGSAGTFTMTDTRGNMISMSDASRWYTLRAHRDPSSSYVLPKAGDHIRSIRGLVITEAKSGGYRGYSIAPINPEDLSFGPRGGSIGGLVYNDIDHDSIYDPGEQGVENWQITLTGKENLQVLTGADGRYLFSDLDTGTYTLRQTMVAGWHPSTLAASYTVTLSAVDSVTGKDFGNFYFGNAIGGMVIFDHNENGIIEPVEQPLPGWLINIQGGQVNDSILTDEMGKYYFHNLPLGTYSVSASTPIGWGVSCPESDYSLTISTNGTEYLQKDFCLHRLSPRVRITVSVSDSNSDPALIVHRNLFWGIRPGASFGIWKVDPNATVIDSFEREFEIPPRSYPLSLGFFDARFQSPREDAELFGEGGWTDIRDFVSPAQMDTFYFNFLPSYVTGGSYPMKLRWSKDLVHSSFIGPVIMTDEFSHSYDMELTDSLTVADQRIFSFRIISQKPNLPSKLTRRWDIISIPRQYSGGRVKDLFPTANSPAYSSQAKVGYTATDTLLPCVGYWLKCALEADTAMYISTVFSDRDTIDVVKGWNMIGTPTVSISVNATQWLPPGIMSTFFYGYRGNYFVADTLASFRGYWVKTKSDGKLIVSGTSVLSKANRLGNKIMIDMLHRAESFTVSDASGQAQTLYFSSCSNKGNTETALFEMPPLPPQGIFDARYASNNILEMAPGTARREYPISISSAVYPVTVRWGADVHSIASYLRVGEREIPMGTRGDITINDPKIRLTLILQGINPLPREYALEQNFPNPFNPVTTIRYALAEKNYVTLMVYNILGQEITTLVNERQDAGYQEVRFDAGSLPSGVYVYRLRAGKFTGAKKMVVLR